MLSRLFARISPRVNAYISYALVLFLSAVAVESFFDAEFLWTGFASAVVVLAVLPAISYRDFRAVVPFEVLLVVCLPFLQKAFDLAFLRSHTVSYLAVAFFALMVFTEMDEFTAFESTPRFNVFFVLITTIALAGVWAVVRWLSDIYLGTMTMPDENTLMWEFTAATGVGFALGLGYNFFLKPRVDEVEL